MRTLKRIAACVVAATAAVTSVAVTASAEDSVHNLLTAEPSDIENANYVNVFAGGIIGYDNVDDPNVKYDIDGLVRLDLEKWRETGEFSYTKVDTDLDMTDLRGMWTNFSSSGGYCQFAKVDAEGNILQCYVVRYDKENNAISTVYTITKDDVVDANSGEFTFSPFTSADGYTFVITSNDTETGILTYVVYSPDGTPSDKKSMSYDVTADYYNWNWYATRNDKYIMFLIARLVGGNSDDEVLPGAPLGNFELYGVRKDGSLETINKTEGYVTYDFASCDDNFVSWRGTHLLGIVEQVSVYSTESKKTYNLDRSIKIAGDETSISPEKVTYVNGTTAIVCSQEYTKDDVNYRNYALIDLEKSSSNEWGHSSTAISKIYRYMSTIDGEIFLVQTEDGKQGYIDKNGNEIATFDNASNFMGDYAPVVQDGKGYLIDRNMQRVTTKVDGIDWCQTYTDTGTYMFVTPDNKALLATYSNATVSDPDNDIASEPAASEPVTEPESKPSSTTQNPNSGFNGIGFVYAAAVAAGVAVVARKKK